MTQRLCKCGSEVKSRNPASTRCGVCYEAHYRQTIRVWNKKAAADGKHCSRCLVKVDVPGTCARCRAYVKAWKSAAKYRDPGKDARLLTKARTSVLVTELLGRQRGCCAACGGKKMEWHLDHIVPLFLGGTDDVGNLQVLCKPCNLRKGRKDPIVFANTLGRLL